MHSFDQQRTVKSKMALTSQQQGWCVLKLAKRDFRRHFYVNSPANKSIFKWYKNFSEKERTFRPSVGLRPRKAYLCSPKSTSKVRGKLILERTVSKTIRKNVHFLPYKMQMVQKNKSLNFVLIFRC